MDRSSLGFCSRRQYLFAGRRQPVSLIPAPWRVSQSSFQNTRIQKPVQRSFKISGAGFVAESPEKLGRLPGFPRSGGGMRGETDQKVTAILVGFENRSGRPVFTHGFQNLGDTRRATFGKIQFFQKLADPAVPVAAAHRPARPEILDSDGPVGSRVTQHAEVLRRYPYFHGFPDFVGPMINGVHHRFFNGRVRVVPEAVGLGPLRVLDHGFL